MLGELHERSPRRIGPYRLLARLGAGGMGEVFLGADTRPSPHAASGHPSLAAVKVVRADLLTAAGDDAFRDRFRREIATARAVEGRFTARLLAGDADAPAPWLATEYVAGPTLDRAVRECGPLPPETVRSLGFALVRALRGIHHARVLHRDLKPANVLLGAGGPRVIDFGIARDFGASTLTATGAMIGSPGYMSPEHVLGGRHVVSASDVFSLASVLCYAATGEGPFGTGPVAAVLYRVSQAEAQLDAVPAELRALIEDCLRPDPSARPDVIALETRLRDAGASDRIVWPDGVRSQVARYEDALADTVRAAGPVAGRLPTMPGASPVHSAQTVTGPPRAPPAATGRAPSAHRDRPRGRRRRAHPRRAGGLRHPRAPGRPGSRDPRPRGRTAGRPCRTRRARRQPWPALPGGSGRPPGRLARVDGEAERPALGLRADQRHPGVPHVLRRPGGGRRRGRRTALEGPVGGARRGAGAGRVERDVSARRRGQPGDPR